MVKRDLVVVGASAGGVEALRELVRGLPSDLAATVMVVLHVPPGARSSLPAILQRATTLSVMHARDGMSLEPGTILVAPPDHHLTLLGRTAHLERGPRINGHRPAVDALFESAARALGPTVIGVVLSGALDDGTAGMLAIRAAGGATLVQSPSDAFYASMPKSVLEQTDVDRVLPASALAAAIADLVSPGERAPIADPPNEVPRNDDPSDVPTEALETDLEAPRDPTSRPSGLTCPECHGALWLVENGKSRRYRCRIGHAYTPRALLAAEAESIEHALWHACRALEETAALGRRLARDARAQNLHDLAEEDERRCADAAKRASALREALDGGGIDAPTSADDGDRRGDDA